MNRLQKKCIIASAGIHLLLVVILFVGPGFISSRSKDDAPPPLDFIPVATVDAALSGGGDNTVKAPPAAAIEPPAAVTPPAAVVPPTPVAPPVVQQTPQPPIEKVERPKVKETPREAAKSDVPSAKPAPHRHEIVPDLKVVTGSSADAKAAREAQAKAAAAAKRREALAFSRALAGIRGGVAGSTEVRLKGPGGGGVPYANFRSAVQKAYFDAWEVPDGVPNVTVTASVTIARDGTVISARITDESGNAAVNASVQRALDRVKFAAPLPESAEEDQRTVTINFNTEAKLEG